MQESEEEGGEDGQDDEEDSDEEDEEETEEQMHIRDETETNLVNLRRTIYLTIMSSVDFEEAGHKLLKIHLAPGQEVRRPKQGCPGWEGLSSLVKRVAVNDFGTEPVVCEWQAAQNTPGTRAGGEGIC